MAEQLTLDVLPRDQIGSGRTGRLRRSEDVVPGVVYGAGVENVNISMSSRVLTKAIQSDNFLSQIIELKMNGVGQQVVVREVQRHPATERVTHIDFLRIREDRAIQVSVPIRFENEDNCIGVRQSGGTITRNLIEVEVSCLPRDLPESIGIDLSELDVGDSVHLSELPLPEGVEIPSLDQAGDRSRDLPVVSVAILRSTIDEEEEAIDEELVEGLAEDAGGDETVADDSEQTTEE